MGSTNSDTQSQSTQSGDKMLSNLKLYDQTTSSIFGPIKILKQTESPFKYIMVYTQNAVSDAISIKKMEQKLNWYMSLRPHSHIVGIEGVRLIQKNQMCIQKLSLQIYTKYYNWTISDAIGRKLQRNQRFKEGDYIYFLQSMLSIVRFFSEIPHRRAFDRFSIHNVFITPQGQIRMHSFPVEVELCQSPKKNGVKAVKSPFLLGSGEQYVVQMSPKKSQKNFSSTISPIKKKKTIINQRDDLRDVGVILFAMMLLNNDIEQIEEYSEQKILQMIEQLKMKSYITEYMQQIIIELLIDDNRDITCEYMEMKLNQIKQTYTVFTANLRLEEGPEFVQPKEIEKNYNFKRLAEHKQLRPGSITILSKQRSKPQQ